MCAFVPRTVALRAPSLIQTSAKRVLRLAVASLTCCTCHPCADTGHLPTRSDQIGKTFNRVGKAAFDSYKQTHTGAPQVRALHSGLRRPSMLTFRQHCAAASPTLPILTLSHASPTCVQVPGRTLESFRKQALAEFEVGGERYREPGTASTFVPAHMIADYEGEERQRDHQHLGSHARAPFGVDRVDAVLGRVNYQTMAQTGPGAFFKKGQEDHAHDMLQQGLGAALAYGRSQAVAKAGAPAATGGSLASQIAHRRLSAREFRRMNQ